MDDEDLDLLSPEDKLREQQMLTRCALLLLNERSRYLDQANELLANKTLKTENEVFKFSYSVREENFYCKAKPKSPMAEWFSIIIPIPDSQEEKIEKLIDLFAESEAGLP